jgi:hypothetical protein
MTSINSLKKKNNLLCVFYHLSVFLLFNNIVKASDFDNTYPHAEKMFFEVLQEVKVNIIPGLSKRERFFVNSVKISIDADTAFSIYIGSDLDKKEIRISKGFVWWIYSRSMASVIEDDTSSFNRAGFLDLYDRLFVYINPKTSVVKYAKLGDDDAADELQDIKNNPNLRRYLLLNLSFIYLHEIGHFVRHTSKMMKVERSNLIDVYNSISPTDTTFNIMMKRMEYCFKYYQFEQLLEVEADAFSLEKMINNLVIVQEKGFRFSLEKIFSNSESILESYKYTKSGSELDFPKATCNSIIRRQMISYTRDSLLLAVKHRSDRDTRELKMKAIARLMEDSVKEVAMVLLNLCALPSDVLEKNMNMVLNDTILSDYTWEYYTAVIQNYLARRSDDTTRIGLSIRTTTRALNFSKQAAGDSLHSNFSKLYKLRLQEFYLFILGTIYEYTYGDIKTASMFYSQGRLIGELVPLKFYDKLLNRAAY